MSDVHLTESERELYGFALGLEELRSTAQAGPHGRVNRPLVKALADHGLLPRLFEHTTAIDLCLVREALARHCPEAETAFGVQGLGGYPILQSGSETLKQAWIPKIADGTAITAFALTEREAGSDARAISTTAQPDGNGGYTLSGEKLWISNAPDADLYTVFARAPEGITAFAVPGELTDGEPIEMLAEHPIGSVRFDGVQVPRDHVLGEPGAGFAVAMRTLDLFRPSVGAFAIGMARHALELAVARTRERHAFGRPLKHNQAVAHRLADIAARVEAARLLVHQAARTHDAGLHEPSLAAMAKLVATEIAQEAVDAAVQFSGASGLETGHPLEKLYREVRAPRIYEGANEIQREIIARSLYR